MSCYLHFAVVPCFNRETPKYVTTATQNVVLRRAWDFWSLISQQIVSVIDIVFNLLTPNVNYSGRTAPLTSKVAFYIFIQQI